MNKINLKKMKLPIAGLLIILLGFGIYTFITKAPQEKITEKTSVVTKGNVSVSIVFDGKAIVDRRDLSFEVAGTVRGVTVKEGDIVKPWQTVAYLDTREAQKNLENQMRDYLAQRNDFEEMIQVTHPDTPTTDTIKRILEKNQWDLENSVADYELKDLAVKKSYLSSPIAGTVAAVNIKPGEYSPTTKIAVTIVDENNLMFESYVEDIDAIKIKKNQQARISFDALPDKTFNATVSFVSPLASVDDNDLSTYKVLITFNDKDISKIIDGMSGEIEIISKEATDVLKIPNTTVKREDGRTIVYIKNDQDTQKQVVELGFTNGKEVEVISGLTVGQTLIDWK